MRWMQTFIFKIILLNLLLFCGVYYLYNNLKIKEDGVSSEIKVLKEKINSINKRKNKYSEFITILENIDKYAKKRVHIYIKKAIKDEIILSISGKLKAVIEVLHYSEQNSSNLYIASVLLKYSKDKKNSVAVIKLKLNNSLIKEPINEEEMSLRLSQIANVFIKYDNKYKPKLYAIIGEHVLVNSRWLKINDKYNNYKIVKINKKYIILNDGKEKRTIKLFKHE